MVTPVFFALLLLAVPIILVAVVGNVLAVGSRSTRVAGLAMLAIVAALLVGGAGLLLLTRFARAAHRAHGYDDARASDPATAADEWISVEKGVVPVATIGEDEPAGSGFEADRRTGQSRGQPADAEIVEAPDEKVGAAKADSLKPGSDAAKADAGPKSQSPVQAISRALLRAVGDSSTPTDDASRNVESDAPAAPVGSTAVETEREGPAADVVSTPVATDSRDIVADDRPSDPSRADMEEIKRYLDEAAASPGIPPGVDSLSPDTILPPQPPPWVNMAAFRIDQIDYRPVASGPYATRDECRRALAEAMKRAVDEYIDEHQGRPGAAHYLDFDLAYIKRHLRPSDVYQEKVQASFGPMIQQHALLQFGQEFREEIERRWKQVKVTSRLAYVSLTAVAILAGLATIYAYLRLDTATKGYYSGRLQIAAGAVILGLVALGVLTARWIPWL